MSLRFRKRVKVLPGVNLNFGKGGVSTTVGKRGASVNVGKQGVRATTGLPGSGLHYSQKIQEGDAAPPPASPWAWLKWVGLAYIVAWLIRALRR